MNCEYCNEEHDRSYGSGRFCNQKCARGFSSRDKREEINKKVSGKLKGIRFVEGEPINICAYGCNQNATYKLSNGKWCCESTYQKCPALKKKNSKGVKNAHSDGKFVYERVYSDEATNKRVASWRKVYNEKISKLSFGEYTLTKKREVILTEQNNKCLCGVETWNDKKLSLELDHIDGNNRNNARENLRFLCPNCHSQTKTFRGRNINTYAAKKVSDAELILAIKHSHNIRQALLKCNLAAKGGNYSRARTLIFERNLKFKGKN